MLKKKIIITMIILLMILISITTLLIRFASIESDIGTTEVIDTVEEKKAIEILKDKNEYLIISNVLETYISNINIRKTSYYGANNSIIVDEKTINTNIYETLSKKYIENKNITVDNVRNFVYKIEKTSFYAPINIYKLFESENKKAYGVYGIVQDMDYNFITRSYLIVYIDQANNSFAIEQLANENDIYNNNIKEIEDIQPNDCNVYRESGIINEEIIKKYILVYKRLAISSPEIVYNDLLDEEYRTKKYGSLEKYKEYIETNKDQIMGINIKKYSVSTEEDYVQYIGEDQNNKFYIFNAKSASNFKIVLDTYTIDTEIFLEKYNNANTLEKVGYNIQKCIDAINDKDYKYVYGKLDETFKENNYKFIDDFINTIKNNLFEYNEVVSAGKVNEGNNYIYELSILDKNNSNKIKKMTVIMQLKEETDFVMSFSFDE